MCSQHEYEDRDQPCESQDDAAKSWLASQETTERRPQEDPGQDSDVRGSIGVGLAGEARKHNAQTPHDHRGPIARDGTRSSR